MTSIVAQERRVTSLSTGFKRRVIPLNHTQTALAPRFKRSDTISSSQRTSDASTSPAAATSPPSVSESLRRVLNFPPRKDSLYSPKQQRADQRYRVFLDEWDKGFMETSECPDGYFADVIYGEIPEDLEGTLFRNGPGKFTLGGKRIPHPYDGDGMVASVAFKHGTAFFKSRFVQTPEYKAEAAADSILFRGTFATQRSGGSMANAGDLYVKNTSNTNVVAFGDRLWSLFEAGQPFRLNPKTLETIGPELLDGLFKAGLPFDLGSKESNSMFATLTRLAQGRVAPAAAAALSDEQISAGGDAVTAHPHLCPVTGRLVTFSYRVRPIVPSSPDQAPFVTDFTFHELENDEKSGKVHAAATRKYTLPGFAFLHDFALTENYYVIFQNPVTVENAPYMLGLAPAASCVRWVKDTPTYVHVIPRKQQQEASCNGKNSSDAVIGTNDDDVMVFSAPPLFVFHHANAFEKKKTTPSSAATTNASGRITAATSKTSTSLVIDSIHYDSLPAVGREALSQQSVDPDAAFTSRLRRVEIDLESRILKVRCAFDGYLEMPAINPNFISKKHKFVYGYHSIFEDPQIALAKVNLDGREVEIWKPGKNRFALEPRFIPRNSSRNSKAGASEVEDDGWIIAQLFDSAAMRSEIVILDAQNLGKGPVAVVALREALPSALHSCWSDKYYGPLEDENDEDSDDATRGGDNNSRFKEVKTNVIPFGVPVLGMDREKLKGSGSVRRSMPTGGNGGMKSAMNDSISESRSKVVVVEKVDNKNKRKVDLKEISSKLQSMVVLLGALWSNLTEI